MIWTLSLLLIAWAGLGYAIPRIENKLEVAVEQKIAIDDHPHVQIAASGRAITLSGEIDSADTADSIIALAKSVPGVGKIVSNLTVVPDQAHSFDRSQENPTSGSDSLNLAMVEAEPDNAMALNPPVAVEQTLPPDRTQIPSFNLRVAGNVLAVEGFLSDEDSTENIVLEAVEGFDLKVVANNLEYSDTVQPAEWLNDIETLLPILTPLNNPELDVVMQQITLGGVAPSQEIHDEIINEALARLDTYSLVERISVAPKIKQQAESKESVAPDVSTESVESTGATAPTAPSESEEPVESPRPAELLESAESAEMTEAADAIVSKEASVPVKLIEAADSIEQISSDTSSQAADTEEILIEPTLSETKDSK